ncbi:Pre-mRNA-splicing factor ATP-dependent RNA helicase [Spathaspora sp. JA1]|nr:Pre-mRNA-splicing factor ATP-dependent RNA helicase [Spathaspora sp. JA1]
MSSDIELFDSISKLVQTHLKVQDDNLTITKFLHNLYKQTKANSKPGKLIEFKRIVKENGGNEFPIDFINQTFDCIYDNENNTKEQGQADFPVLHLQDRSNTPKNDERNIRRENNNKTTPRNKEVRQNGRDYSDDSPLEVGQIYRGYVNEITPYGAFIRLRSPTSYQSGLCHISQISNTRIQSVSDVLEVNQSVFVKVIEVKEQHRRQRISLSMKEVDQVTGLENRKEEEQPRGRTTSQMSKPVKRKLTSPERWELRQLISSGIVSREDYPELTEEENNQEFKHEPELEINIELNPTQPKFLKGQKLKFELPTLENICKPEGSLKQIAEQGSELVREFRQDKLKAQKETTKDSFDPLFQREQSEPVDETASKKDTFISQWKKSQKNVTYGKITNLPIQKQRQQLPIYSMRSELVEQIRNNQFLVIVGETGSGKTTQIVQYIKEEAINKDSQGKTKIIGCTQPRRVAAQSVAKRVSEEIGCKLGEEVGYTVRFDDNTSSKTVIKYMTDGMLQREAINDPYMSKYSVIMLDEAHERTIATDVLFALLKKAVAKNPELKVIVTSATLDSTKFSNFFNNCPIVKIPGRTYPVEILYTKEPELDYLAAALDSVMQIHLSEPAGDILVFLTGQEEIDSSCEVLFQRMKILGDSVPELIILPVYSALPSEIQSRIFEPTPAGSRKVVLATNIAETSITIDGIYYVIDPGFVKINAYDPKLGMDSLTIHPISQAQANQRSGRAGRTGPGKCYRLYTEQAYNKEMIANTVPEIQRTNLSHTILMLKAMGINDLLTFEFMDPPSNNTMLVALQDLYTLDALDDEGYLTSLGQKMANFPMEPTLSKTLIKSVEFECTEEILTIVAMLSVQTIFYRPKEQQKLADQRKLRFHHPLGDHLTLLNVFQSWQLNGYNKTWCSDNFIQERSMRRAMDVRKQLKTIMVKYGYILGSSCGSNIDVIRKTLCAGYFKNISKRETNEGYKTLSEETPVHLHPSSCLFGKNPEYVLFHSLLLTTREYMHCVTVIEPKWLIELAPKFFKPGSAEQKKQERIVPLFKGMKDEWRLSSQKKRHIGR